MYVNMCMYVYIYAIRRFLTYDPSQRITAQEALKHPWFDDLNEYVRLKELDGVNATTALASMISSNDFANVRS